MFRGTRPASQARETVFQLAAIEERLDDRPDDRTQRAGFRLKALLVERDVAIEVLVEDLVEGRALGMPRSVDGGPVLDEGQPAG